MKTGHWMVLGIVAALAVTSPLAAQRTARGAGGGQGAALARQGMGVEGILRLRSSLELTDQQVADLNAIREEQLEGRQEAARFRMRLRSDMETGELTRADARERARERRETMAPGQEGMRSRIESILTEDQLEALRTRRNRAVRASRRGTRASARSDFRGAVRQRAIRPGTRRIGVRGTDRTLRDRPPARARGFAPRPRGRRPLI